jgi:hypothetical protein
MIHFSFVVVVHSVVLVSSREPPEGTTCRAPTLLKNKVMFYSPSIIGEDTHISKIDLYTEYFSNLHEVW